MTAPLTAPTALQEALDTLTGWRLPTRRHVEPGSERAFLATMRDDLLTPDGTPNTWQELTAAVHRSLIDTGVPSAVPVRYRWDRVDARTGDPEVAGAWREWTFARGHSFTSLLMHTGIAGGTPASGEPAPPQVGYPDLPETPEVGLLRMLSWDVITFETLCTQLLTTPGLRTLGGQAELQPISDSWAGPRFAGSGAVAVLHNVKTARNLGYGAFAGRPSAVFSVACLDSVLVVRSGPVTQHGRSSHWITLQADAETGDLLSAEMTEMVAATLTGPQGQRVPVQKRRTVRMFVGSDILAEEPPAVYPAPPAPRAAARPGDPTSLAAAVRLAGRIADHLIWQASSLQALPQGMADLVTTGFRGVAGADLIDTYRRVRALQAGLRAAILGDGTIWTVLPEHRRQLERLLAFGQFAADGTHRLPQDGQPGRGTMNDRMRAVRVDLTALLILLDRLEQPYAGPSGANGSAAAHRPSRGIRPTGDDCEGQAW